MLITILYKAKLLKRLEFLDTGLNAWGASPEERLAKFANPSWAKIQDQVATLPFRREAK